MEDPNLARLLGVTTRAHGKVDGAASDAGITSSRAARSRLQGQGGLILGLLGQMDRRRRGALGREPRRFY